MSHDVKTESTAVLQINREWCKGCGICVAFCPKEALFLDKGGKVDLKEESCSCCGVCATFCPDFALAVIKGRLVKYGGSNAGPDARQ